MIQIIRNLDIEIWRQFVAEHPQGNIFHTPEMFQVFAQTKGYQPELWAAVDEAGQVLALLPVVVITLINGMFHQFTSRAIAYGSVLCASGVEGQIALTKLLSTYNQETKGYVLFTELRNLSDLGDLQSILHEHDFVYEDHLNFLIDLRRSQAEIWKNIRSNARRNIQKARKSEVVIEEVNDIKGLPDAYMILKEVYKRIQVPLPDLSLFESTFNVLYPKGMLKILMARVNNLDIGVLTLLLYKGVVYYWYTGTLREHASYRANDLLVWHTLELGNQNGYHLFDFGGGGKPSEEYGVRDFKAKFGGELVNYGRNICVHAPTRLKVSQLGYQLVRKLL